MLASVSRTAFTFYLKADSVYYLPPNTYTCFFTNPAKLAEKLRRNYK